MPNIADYRHIVNNISTFFKQLYPLPDRRMNALPFLTDLNEEIEASRSVLFD
jgi:hypothetical protein